ncbi:hypothetical protein [Cardiobacterium valvarum]
MLNFFIIIFNNNYVYLTDEKIIKYFYENRKEFVDLIELRRKDCGKYFKEEVSGKEKWYKDEFSEKSIEARYFLARHSFIKNLDSWRTIYVQSTDEDSVRGHTFEKSLNECLSYPYMTFLLGVSFYKKDYLLVFNRDYSVSKAILYLPNPNLDKVKDWNLYMKNRIQYNSFFEKDFSSRRDILNDSNLSGNSDNYPKDSLSRPSDVSSDYNFLHCQNYASSGFVQIEKDWYIYAFDKDGYYYNECNN